MGFLTSFGRKPRENPLICFPPSLSKYTCNNVIQSCVSLDLNDFYIFFLQTHATYETFKCVRWCRYYFKNIVQVYTYQLWVHHNDDQTVFRRIKTWATTGRMIMVWTVWQEYCDEGEVTEDNNTKRKKETIFSQNICCGSREIDVIFFFLFRGERTKKKKTAIKT